MTLSAFFTPKMSKILKICARSFVIGQNFVFSMTKITFLKKQRIFFAKKAQSALFTPKIGIFEKRYLVSFLPLKLDFLKKRHLVPFLPLKLDFLKKRHLVPFLPLKLDYLKKGT